MAETAPASRTYKEIFRQSGLAWRACIAIFITEFILASTWASYCFINLYNIKDDTCEFRNIFWPIFLLLCSMKFFSRWFESWILIYNVHILEIIGDFSENEPNSIIYKKAMTAHKLMKRKLMHWTWLVTVLMWAVWSGIALVGLGRYYLLESALHVLLGLLAGAISTFFRYLNKLIYWNNYSNEIYDSISQMAKATCLIVNSLGFIRAAEFLPDPFWLRVFIALLILLTFPMVLVVCSGNHFCMPPAGIDKDTPVQEPLPSKPPTPPSISESSPPAQVTPTFGLPAGSSSYDSPAMLSQKFKRLSNTSSSSPDNDENRISSVVKAEVHGDPNTTTRELSSPPGIELNDMAEGARGIQGQNLDDIQVTEDSQWDTTVQEPLPSKPPTPPSISESSPPAQVTPTFGLPAGSSSYDSPAMLSQKFKRLSNTSSSSPDNDENRISSVVKAEVHGDPNTTTRELSSPPGTLKNELNDMAEKPCDGIVRENLDDIQVIEDSQCFTQEKAIEEQRNVNKTSSPGHSAVVINLNPQNPTVSYRTQRRESEVPRSTEPACPNIDVTSVTVTETNSSSYHTSGCNCLKCLCGTTTPKDESSRTQIPKLNLIPASPPRSFTPQVKTQDKHNLCVEGGRKGSRKRLGPHHPDSNQLHIDFEELEPEPTRLEASAVHAFKQSKDDCEMRKALAPSVKYLLRSLRRSFRKVWFWYAIVSTALVNLTSVLFLVACPHLALDQDGKDFVTAGYTLMYIAVPWLVVSLVLCWPLKKLPKKPFSGCAFCYLPVAYMMSLVVASYGMQEQLKLKKGKSDINSLVLFGVGFGIIANLKKTVHKVFFYDYHRSPTLPDERMKMKRMKSMIRNAECGIGVILIVFYICYYYLFSSTEGLPKNIGSSLGVAAFISFLATAFKGTC